MYREHAPAPSLRPYVRCYWTIRSKPTGPRRVLPDGCTDVVFDREDAGAARFVGTMTTALALPGDRPTDVVGVRFEPGAARAFLAVSASEITDGMVDVGEIWRAGRDLAERIAASADPVALLDVALAARLADTGASLDPAVIGCVRRIEAAEGRIRLEELERLTGLSARQLERRFAAEVGIGPKRFARVARFAAALERAPAVRRGEWASAASELGFADQSHLLREVRALAGVSLADLLASR